MKKIVLGLGNPGEKYERSFHNVGFRTLDSLASVYGLEFKKKRLRKYLYCETSVGDDDLVLIKPLTYMNLSGSVIPAVFQQFKGSRRDLIVICDTMDLPLGKLRLKSRGGSGGQKGLESIIHEVSSNEFARIFIGIGRPENRSVVEHVLRSATDDELAVIERAIESITKNMSLFFSKPIESIQNEINGN